MKKWQMMGCRSCPGLRWFNLRFKCMLQDIYISDPDLEDLGYFHPDCPLSDLEARVEQPEAKTIQGAASAYTRKHASGGNLESAFKAGVAWLAPRTPVESAFRELRRAWFDTALKSYPHERDGESDDAEERRTKQNAEMKKKYDADTQALIRGEKKCLAPRSANDLY